MSKRKKECELCSNPARMLCDSDQARLCWKCDEKVHSANFLVAKHSRTLLCHVCQSPTPWNAAGPKLGPTVSVCHACFAHSVPGGHHPDACHSPDHGSESDEGDYYTDETDDFTYDDDDDEEDDEDGENQVVPWSASASSSPPPPPAMGSSFSSSEEENVPFSSSSKRTRENTFESEDEDGCCSSRLGASESDENYSCSLSVLRPKKMQRRSNDSSVLESEQEAERQSWQFNPSSGTAAIVEKLQRFKQEIVTEEGDVSAMILGLCKLTGVVAGE